MIKDRQMKRSKQSPLSSSSLFFSCRRHHHHHHAFLRLSLFVVIISLPQLILCDNNDDDRTKELLEERSLEEQKRSPLEVEPRYDLVLALIEKYLKEKSSQKLQDENSQNHISGSENRGCSKFTSLNADSEGTISYPTSGTYRNSETCEWKLEASSDKSIELTVRRLSVEATEDCRWDRLEIFDGESSSSDDSRLALLCGFILPAQPFVTTGNIAVVRFTSDDNIGYGGFKIDFKPVTPSAAVRKPIKDQTPRPPPPPSPPPPLLPPPDAFSSDTFSECVKAKELKEPSGVIRFPLSGIYDNNLSCKWRITASAGKVVQMTVTSIDIEAAEDCDSCCWFDWLSIYDGRYENASRLMRKLCGTVAPSSPVTTSSNVALVVFKSNARNGEDGFQINYRTMQKEKARLSGSGLGVCAVQVIEIRNSSGKLESPGFADGTFPENSRCRWRLIAPIGQVIRVTFESLNLENDVTCVYDSLSIYDGFNRTLPLIGRFCGKKIPSDVTSSGQTLMVIFESDSSMSDGGFSLRWTFLDREASSRKVTPGCAGQTAVLDGQYEGVFATPNYGNGSEYPNSAACSWRIVVEPSMKVFLRFEKFSLEPPLFDTECYDSVSIYDGSNASAAILGSYCGVYTPSDLLSSSNQIYVSFKSDKSTSAPGFLARYAAKQPSTNVLGSECGVPDVMPKVYSRIVGGVEATPHSWPWQISIKYSGHDWHHWCGGSLLYPHWIITAAHCVHGFGPASNFKVILGEHNQLINEGTEIEMTIKEIIIHDKYDDETNDNDIALFRLPSDVQYNRYIKPICLPKEDVEANILCITTGWGDTKSTGNESLLNQVYVPVVSRIECNQPTWYAGQLTDNMLCAGYPEGRKDSCQGDSGGPMVCLTEGKWRLIGLTSWGYDCALSHHPGIYTRVTRYLGWIQLKTGVIPT